MGIFSRGERSDATYPFLTAQQAAAMRDAARDAVTEAGLTAVFLEGEAVLDTGGTIGFDNIARAIAQIPAGSPELQAMVGHYVTSVIESMTAENEPVTEALLAERGYLRLVDATMFPPSIEADYAYGDRIGDRVRAIVTVDEPHTIRTVPLRDLAGVGVERARQLGYVNLVKDADFEHEKSEVDGGLIHSLTGPSMFVGSRLLALSEELARIGAEAPHGVIAIAPDRHHVHFHVIEGLGVVKVVNLLQNVALGAYNDEQGAISPCVYWWHGGNFTQLTAFDADGTVSISVPEELAEIFNTLT